MKTPALVAAVALAALSGCGLENFFGNAAHQSFDRPSSEVTGKLAFKADRNTTFTGLDGGGNPVTPFVADAVSDGYRMKFPSSKYSFLRVQGRGGNIALRALVPSVGEESRTVENLDARSTTEALIVEAWLAANAKRFAQLTPAAYVGDGTTTGTRTLIRADLDRPGPAQDLLAMVERILARGDVTLAQPDPDFFTVPVLDAAYVVRTSPVSSGFLARAQLDYSGDGVVDVDSSAFDAKLSAAAQQYSPAGCPDPNNVRVVFTVDFRAGSLNGNCGSIDRFKWAKDAPGKQMFFVGWVHEDSPIQNPAVNSALGASTPNTIPMHDDGTNGDEVAGDGVWTVAFDVPKGIRIGYKYTWGFRGAPWTGSEEWPGNSRIIQADDLNGDNLVFRRDVFGDEATNKDKSNLYNGPGGTGVVGWTTDLHGCGSPEARENKYDNAACGCAPIATPPAIGPLTLACPVSP